MSAIDELTAKAASLRQERNKLLPQVRDAAAEHGRLSQLLGATDAELSAIELAIKIMQRDDQVDGEVCDGEE